MPLPITVSCFSKIQIDHTILIPAHLGSPRQRAVKYCLFHTLYEGLFVALGLSGVIPAGHFVITDGLSHAFNYAALGWVMLMAFLYITGAVIYAARVPERIWPGRFDIWVSRVQSILAVFELMCLQCAGFVPCSESLWCIHTHTGMGWDGLHW